MLKDIIKWFVIPMQLNAVADGGGTVELDEAGQAMLDKALAGDETEEEQEARLELGIKTPDEITADEAGDGADPDESDQEREERERLEAEGGGAGKSKTVPHKRFNEVVMQRNFYSDENATLKAENAALKAGKTGKQPPAEEEEEYDYDEAEDRYLAAIKEGNIKDAKAIRKEINEQVREDAVKQVTTSLNLDERFQQHGTAITETQKVRVFTDRMEVEFPQYNKKHKDFNAELVSDTLETYRAYVAGGMPQSEAIEKATKLHAKAVGIDITKPPAKGLSEAAAQTAAERAAEARKRGAAAGKNQPPRTTSGQPGSGGKHANIEDIDVETLSDEEFNALPEATKKKLRGDEVG